MEPDNISAPVTVAPAFVPDLDPNVLATWDDRVADAQGDTTEPAPVDDMQAETEVELIPPGYLAVPIGGRVVHVQPRGAWYSSTLNYLNTGDIESWAAEALWRDGKIDEYTDVWCEINEGHGPTLDEFGDMMALWQKLTGDDVGKAPLSRASLRRTRRR